MTRCDHAPADGAEAVAALAHALEHDLFERHGPLIADDALRLALGYRSMEAFRQAMVRRTVPVPVFALANRRGKYALVKDVAWWLAELRIAAANPSERKKTDDAPNGQGGE